MRATNKNIEDSTLDLAKRVRDLLTTSDYCQKEAKKAQELVEKLGSDMVTVSIIGQFKRGKSSMVNKILGENIMPVGIVPVTAAATRVIYGEKISAFVDFLNGRREEIPLEDLDGFINEQENQNNKLGVEKVTITCPSSILQKGIELVDTPGVGSFHHNNTESAYKFMKESDAVVFLLSVDSPINQIEIEFLESTKDFAAKLFFAVNKVDTVSESDLVSYQEYCSSILKRTTGLDAKIFPVSAKMGYGLEELTDAILKEVKEESKEILEKSVERKLLDLLRHTEKQLDFYWKAMRLSFREMDKRFAQISLVIADSKTKARTFWPPYSLALNDAILYLQKSISQVFDLPYSIPLCDIVPGSDITEEEFHHKFDQICGEQESELKRVLMYREENAHTVVTRISQMNMLNQRLRVIEKKLSQRI